MDNKNLGRSLVQVVGDSGFFDTLRDVGEIILDGSMNNGLLRGVPIFGSISQIFKTGGSVKEHIFEKKLIRFLSALKDVPFKKREKFREKLNKDKEFQRKVGEQLLLILDRLDNMDKPYLVAHAFAAYMEDIIDYESFQRLASALDKTFHPDLISFNLERNYKQLSTDTILNLINSGILELEAMPSIKLSAKNNKYRITELGKQLLEVVLKKT